MIEIVFTIADKMNMKSIALPGPNGDVLNMPMSKACDIILTVINAFLMKQSDQSCLRKIVVILSSQRVVRSMLCISKDIFGSRTLLTESASSILADDNPSQHIESTKKGNTLFTKLLFVNHFYYVVRILNAANQCYKYLF